MCTIQRTSLIYKTQIDLAKELLGCSNILALLKIKQSIYQEPMHHFTYAQNICSDIDLYSLGRKEAIVIHEIHNSENFLTKMWRKIELREIMPNIRILRIQVNIDKSLVNFSFILPLLLC